jgi:hypothetical protein
MRTVPAWLLALFASFTCSSQALPGLRSATVPFHFDDNRVFIDLTFTRPDGNPRTARFWVDTGGGGFLMAQPLARDLGLDLSGKTLDEGGATLLPIAPPAARMGSLPLDLKDVRAFVIMQKTIQDGFNAEGLLPGHVLERYQVVIDYGSQQFTLALPGTLKMTGIRLTTPVQRRSGFPRFEINISGKAYGFLLDCGAAYTMVSQAVLDDWAVAHPEWPRATGAVGAANMGLLTEDGLVMTRVPEMQLGDVPLKAAGMVARPKGTFENWMSPMMTAPIAGAVGGNVLRNYRVQIDYAENATYLEKINNSAINDPDAVGLILHPEADGSFIVLGVAQKDGKPALEGVAKKDKLLKIEGVDISGKSMPEVLRALQGKAGEIRRLLLERDGKLVSVAAPVVRFL